MARRPTNREARRFIRLWNDEPDLTLDEAARIFLQMDADELRAHLSATHAELIGSLPQRQLALFNEICALAGCENLALVSVSPATRTARTSGE